MIRTVTFSAAALIAATSFASAGNIFVELAKQDDDRAAVRALQAPKTSNVAVSTKSPRISALEVALKHAIENDDRMLAAHIKRKLGR